MTLLWSLLVYCQSHVITEAFNKEVSTITEAFNMEVSTITEAFNKEVSTILW